MARALETYDRLRRAARASYTRATTALASTWRTANAGLAARGARGAATASTASTAHRRWSRGTTLIFVLLLIAVVVNGLIALRSFRLLVARERLVSQSDATEARVATLETRMLDARNSERGYLLTGDPQYISAYAAAHLAVEQEWAQLHTLTATDTVQQQRVAALRLLISAKFAQLQQSIDLRAHQQPDAATAALDSAASVQTTASINSLLDQLAVMEQQERDVRLLAANRSMMEAQMTTLLATLADILLVLAFFVFVQRSLAAREQHLRSEQQARTTAETAVVLRDQFLSIASHELRTPITALLTAVTLLERRLQGELVRDGVQRQSFAVLRRQLARMEALIATMLDVSRIDRGQLALTWGTFDLVALACEVVEDAQATSEAHTIELHTSAQELLVRGDALRLEQAAQNLLQNAIKYSPGGGVVQVELRRDGAWASLAVADQGIGIPQDALAHIFDRFYRAPTVRSEHISGLGIGLFVAHEIVALHGGEILVTSTEGMGTTFIVRLPLLTSDITSGIISDTAGEDTAGEDTAGEDTTRRVPPDE